MKFQLDIKIPLLQRPINYNSKILLIGSCFTEHIAGRLAMHKFKVLQNPNGILFNPQSVADSLQSYATKRLYTSEDLFLLNETWSSWAHHSKFSHINKVLALEGINSSQAEAAAFIKDADWIIITLGSAFQYYLKENDQPVANNHRAPAALFEKKLSGTGEIQDTLKAALEAISLVNTRVNVLFTISPVRHIRDGITDNNRSKARLIEAVHYLCDHNANCHYFPAYEIVVDILRDYRFYDVDMVHPNYAATESVWEYFIASCIDKAVLPVMERVKDIMTAKTHRARFPATEGHRKFLDDYAAKVQALAADMPSLDLRDELQYFLKKE